MLEYWFMFPIAIVIASIAMMSGIGGAILFSPLFIIILRIEPTTAIAAGLAIEMFGFSSGVIGYYQKKLIDFTLVKQLVIYSVPATIVGVVLAKFVYSVVLKVLLGILLLYLAQKFLRIPKKKTVKRKGIDTFAKGSVGVGGLLIGMISSGLGEINEFLFLQRMKLTTAKASATSVFLVAMSAIVGVIAHAAYLLYEANPAVLNQAGGLVLFSVPGVIIGAQIGVYLSQHIKREHMQTFLGILFSLLGFTMLSMI